MSVELFTKRDPFQKGIGIALLVLTLIGAIVCLLPLTGRMREVHYYRLLSVLLPFLVSVAFAYLLYGSLSKNLKNTDVIRVLLFLLSPITSLLYGRVNYYSAPFLCAVFAVSVYLALILISFPRLSISEKSGWRKAAFLSLSISTILNGYVYLCALTDSESMITALLCAILSLPNWLLLSFSVLILRKNFLSIGLFSSPLFLLFAGSGRVSLALAFSASAVICFLPIIVCVLMFIGEKNRKLR